jgi:hypothetical protein
MTDEDRRLPGYEEEEAAPQTAQEWVARYRWVTPEQAAEYVEETARERRLVARTAAEVGLDPQWPDQEQQDSLFPEKPGEMADGLPLITREARDGFLVLLLRWFGLKRFVRLVPRERWEEALAAVYEEVGRVSAGASGRSPMAPGRPGAATRPSRSWPPARTSAGAAGTAPPAPGGR